jgi:hypothetical protein
MNLKTLSVAAATGAILLAAAAPVLAATRADRSTPCFFVTQWRGWKSPNPDTIYLGINNHDIYEVKLAGGGSTQLSWPDMHLVSIDRGGSGSVCNALDLDLKIADTNGFAEPLIAKSLRKLTPAEVAAVPPKYRPN